MTKPESKLCLIKFELDIDVIIFNCGFKNDLRICTQETQQNMLRLNSFKPRQTTISSILLII